MHSGTGFWSGFNMKMEYKNQKIKMSGQLSGMARYCTNFFCWKSLLPVYIVWFRRRNRNLNFSKVGTWTTINHYGCTTLYFCPFHIVLRIQSNPHSFAGTWSGSESAMLWVLPDPHLRLDRKSLMVLNGNQIRWFFEHNNRSYYNDN